MSKETVLNLIKDARETSLVDFKRECYPTLKNSDIPKDIAAFANIAPGEEKYIIFGVDDKTREGIGIDPSKLPTQDDIDAYIAKTIDPFVYIVVDGFFLDDERYIGYFTICSTNTNPPYIIKETCGKNNRIESGDIYIRKGTCNLKASRNDLNCMYVKNGSVHVRIYQNLVVIKPIHCDGEVVDAPTYGQIDLEIFNDTTRPVLINGGYISIKSTTHSVERGMVTILPKRLLVDTPLELAAQSRKVHTGLFDFLSQDCVDFGFALDGYMDGPVTLQVTLFDTDDNKYISEPIEAMLLAKGDILHKVRLKEYYDNLEKLSLREKLKFWLGHFGRP